MLISNSKKFIFVHIYKTAGSSVTRALGEYAYGSLATRILNTLGYRKSIKSLGLYRYHITAKELEQELPNEVFDVFYKFAFVRNPWDWQVSLYHYTLQNKLHPQRKLVRRMKGFDEYLEWKVSEDKKLQKEFVTNADGKIIVDFIGKYESMTEDFQHVCDALGISTSLPHINKSKHRSYHDYYNAETRRLIEDHYGEDIDLFGYSFDEQQQPSSAVFSL